MKKILGLDLGTNSIGWAVLNAADDNSLKYIEAAGSRIIPMDAAILGDFDRGNFSNGRANKNSWNASFTRTIFASSSKIT